MATDFENIINNYICLEQKNIDFISNLRIFEDLKIGYEDSKVWIKGLTNEQMESKLILSIPNIQRFYEQSNYLFLWDSLLPFCKLPSLLWTPIQRGIPVELPTENFNYFGFDSKIELSLIANEEEKETVLLKIPLEELENYLISASKIRLQNLSWLILDQSALVLGTPILPISAESFWKLYHFILPSGYTLNLMGLAEKINTNLISTDQYLFWEYGKDAFFISKNDFKPLSLSSFRRTVLKK